MLLAICFQLAHNSSSANNPYGDEDPDSSDGGHNTFAYTLHSAAIRSASHGREFHAIWVHS